MERERYRRMRAVLRNVERQHHGNARHTHIDSTVLLVALWAALHNKPISWAKVPKHSPGDLRPRSRVAGQRGLPSQSCMSRRLRVEMGSDGDPQAHVRDCQESVLDLLERWQAQLRRQLSDSDVKLIDGRGLVVGGCTKDPDAGFGYAAGLKIKGYKLHWMVDLSSGAIDGWLVMPMNYGEQEAARHLMAHLPGHTRFILADNGYDSNRLYEQAGVEQGLQWMAMPRRSAKGLGHARQSKWRVSVQRWLRSHRGKRTMKAGIVIEQVNGRLGCATVGLNHLPYHAWRLHRVTLWTALKVLILTDLQISTQHKSAA
jgi:hypothetical protein